MYKITKITDNFEIKGIKDGIDPEFNLTYLEIEIRNTVQSSINKTVFFQEIIPNCNVKYWKIENNTVVEMSESEKEYIDKKELYEAKKIEFLQKRYRVTVNSLSTEDTGFGYVLATYPLLQPYCTSQGDILTRVDPFTLNSIAYFNLITEYFDNIITNDSRFVKEDVEIYNPD